MLLGITLILLSFGVVSCTVTTLVAVFPLFVTVIVALNPFRAVGDTVINPSALTVATLVELDVYVVPAEPCVRSCVLPSVSVPVTCSCWVAPGANEMLLGVTLILLSLGVVSCTVTTLVAVFPLFVTVIVALNPFRAVGDTVISPSALTVATLVELDVYVVPAEPNVRSCVLPSVNVPVTCSC
jgi:hypothetical protein